MVRDMSRREEQRGTNWMFAAASIVAVAAGIGLLVWFFVPGFSEPETPKNAGVLSDQTVGMSTASKHEPLPTTSSRSTDLDTVQRNQDLTATGTGNLQGLSQQQVQAVRQFAANNAQQAAPQVDFSIAVGAAVPANVKLADFPPQLAQAMPDYAKDQYFIVNNQFVVVEKQTRRIVVIVTVKNTKESSR